ncbi:MAG: excinuclease ABC subunit UvrC [Gammaproteobacteria bacterium]|nr:MAG: excinuclease ABC subunit UvrC [Gammaproteobacteria bacterium]UCH41440.1 MAG: excinuclease ABC subunit UvrC [Gammaproteobacteria bacterium]
MTQKPGFDHKAFLDTVNSKPGVYRMIDKNDKVIYVGKAKNLKKRLSSYFRRTGLTTRIISLVNNIHKIEVINTRTESEALLLENDLIKNLNPRYNILFRDDKSYPYICLTNHEFPRLRVFRGKPDKRKGIFFGPFPSAGSIRYTINHVQRMFKLRNCEDSAMKNRTRACLQYQIKRCTGPCVGHTDRQSYQRQIEQAQMFLEGRSSQLIDQQIELMEKYSANLDFEQAAEVRDRIETLRRVTEKQFVTNFDGDIDIIACEMQQDYSCIQLFMIRNGTSLGNKPFYNRARLDTDAASLLETFIMQHYSNHPAPPEIIVSHALENSDLLAESLHHLNQSRVSIKHNVRDKRKRALENAINNARQALESYLLSASMLSKRYQSLVEILHLEQPPERIECFDISHTMGESTRASCVVFGRDGAVKSEYRRYNIADIQAGDDYAAMRQVLERRYSKRRDMPDQLPDLILIDGGKGQLGVALDVLDSLNIPTVKENLRVFGVAKGVERRAGYEQIIDEEMTALNLPMSAPGLLLIQQIRDEAHRFAITGHRQARAKARRKSRLEEIPGIGARKRQLLLNTFGGLQGVKAAGVEELMQIRGINRETAQAIYDSFHG